MQEQTATSPRTCIYPMHNERTYRSSCPAQQTTCINFTTQDYKNKWKTCSQRVWLHINNHKNGCGLPGINGYDCIQQWPKTCAREKAKNTQHPFNNNNMIALSGTRCGDSPNRLFVFSLLWGVRERAINIPMEPRTATSKPWREKGKEGVGEGRRRVILA